MDLPSKSVSNSRLPARGNIFATGFPPNTGTFPVLSSVTYEPGMTTIGNTCTFSGADPVSHFDRSSAFRQACAASFTTR